MQTNKVLIGGIVGGVAFFFLGWIIYGMLLMGAMKANAGSATGVHKEPMEMWAIVLSNFGLGFMFSYIFSRYAAMPSAMDGLKQGVLIGLLMTISFDFMMYSMTNLMTLKGVIMDVVAFAVMCGLGAAIIAFVMSMGKKTEV